MKKILSGAMRAWVILGMLFSNLLIGYAVIAGFEQFSVMKDVEVLYTLVPFTVLWIGALLGSYKLIYSIIRDILRKRAARKALSSTEDFCKWVRNENLTKAGA